MQSNTQYKSTKKLKRELKTLKLTIKVMFILYVISIISILAAIKHYPPDHKKNGKKIIANMIIKESLKD